jgi:predicted GIY-YIG superfamily endonuclease
MARTSLYRFYDENNELLYVGITNNLPARIKEHADEKTWWPLVTTIHVTHISDRKDARLLEATVIRTEHPRYNLHHNEPEEDEILVRQDGRLLTPERDRAETLLRAILIASPAEAAKIIEEAKTKEISEKTLRRAKTRLGVIARPGFDQDGKFASWIWELPPDEEMSTNTGGTL